MATSLTFHGATGGVTGSRFLLQSGDERLLVECGLFQGGRDERQLNWASSGFDARGLAGVVVTHAHLDHCGYLPRLVHDGYQGRVYATPATSEIAAVVLRDAAQIEEEDAEYANRKGFSRHRPALPLFTRRDAERAIGLFSPVRDEEEREIGGFRLRFHRAGHILGSAVAEIWHPAAGTGRMVFSGDLGRHNMPLHEDPEPRPECTTLVLESTYGDRVHPHRSLEEELADAARPALMRGGVVLIPSFAVARAQLVALVLVRTMVAGRIPRVPIHIDSPMASSVFEIYRHYAGSDELDRVQRSIAESMAELVVHHPTPADSRSLNGLHGPAIIVAGSGMLTGGRVLHHLRWVAPGARNAIVLAGYQAAGTRGRDLAEGGRHLNIHGIDVPVQAEVAVLQGFSAHADQDELAEWAAAEPKPRTIFLVHGEPQARAALAERLRMRGLKVNVPAPHQAFLYDTGSHAWRSAGSAPPGPGRPTRRS